MKGFRYILILILSLLLSATFAKAGTSKIKIGAFNIRIFGKKKASNPQVMKVIVEILKRYDVVLIQEIRAKTDHAIEKLLSDLNKSSKYRYSMLLSSRLGRSSSTEQYAYFYRTSRLEVTGEYEYNNYKNTYSRTPYVARFKVINSNADFSLIGIHTQPDRAKEEVNELTEVYQDMYNLMGEEDAILLGDFNASCNYVRKSHFKDISLRNPDYFSWIIGDNVDTTTTRTHCAYDRFVTTRNITANIVPNSYGPFLFDRAYGLDPLFTEKVSDHYPIEMELSISTSNSNISTTVSDDHVLDNGNSDFIKRCSSRKSNADKQTFWALKRVLRVRNCQDLYYTMQSVTSINLSNAGITDLSPLRGFIQIQNLNLASNKIEDISILQNFVNLAELNLSDNYISNVMPLSLLTQLISLDVRWNYENIDLTPLTRLGRTNILY